RHALPPARSLGALRDPRPAPGAVSRLRPAQLRAPRPALGRARLVQERGAARGVGPGAPPRPLGTAPAIPSEGARRSSPGAWTRNPLPGADRSFGAGARPEDRDAPGAGSGGAVCTVAGNPPSLRRRERPPDLSRRERG